MTQNISKRFNDVQALNEISLHINKGAVFGLVGTNGAGKSTFLRLLAGIYRPDTGEILIDEQPVWENAQLKSRLFYISDEQYFFANATPQEVAHYYNGIYPNFDLSRFVELMQGFELTVTRKISTFSKGMKKQLSVILGLCSGVDYIFCDETFDGLDPVMRHAVKSLFAADVADRGLTPIIASHNLRELEDICDHVGLLHRGGVLLEKDLDDMKLGAGKVQCVAGGRGACQPGPEHRDRRAARSAAHPDCQGLTGGDYGQGGGGKPRVYGVFAANAGGILYYGNGGGWL